MIPARTCLVAIQAPQIDLSGSYVPDLSNLMFTFLLEALQRKLLIDLRIGSQYVCHASYSSQNLFSKTAT